VNNADDFCYFCGEVTFSSQKVVRAMDQIGYLAEKFPGISAAKKSRKVFSSVHRSSTCSEMSSLTAFSVATRRQCEMISGL
jgi:hypothetical protein